MKRGWMALLCLLVVVSLVAGTEIDPEILEALEDDQEVRVIVLLEEPSEEEKEIQGVQQAIDESQEEVLDELVVKEPEEPEENFEPAGAKKLLQKIGIAEEDPGYDLELKHTFEIVNGFSGNITKRGLEKLDNPNVVGVYLDRKVSLFLDDSVPQIDANKAWLYQVGGINITGLHQSVCVIDTGIDYTHNAFGNCSPANVTTSGDVETLATLVESDHPYNNSEDVTYSITKPGYTNIAVHFANISLEVPTGSVDTTDRVIVKDKNNATLAVYRGNQTDVWSPYAEGDTMFIQVVTDGSLRFDGFYIDQVINGTTNLTMNWSSCKKVIGGWDMVNTDNDPMDDQGHGTHVAGIVASENETYRGVAPNATLVGIKALDSGGGGYFSDVAAGIDFCTNNKEALNISVITMSLGTKSSHYTAACDSTYPTTTAAINKAVGRNITVVVASGNEAKTDRISSPACITNATSVGSVSDSDAVVSSSNSASFLDILAPGGSITSTTSSQGSTCGGGTADGFANCGGTSMATPHAAGAMALLYDYWSRTLTEDGNPSSFLKRFQISGLLVNDTKNNLIHSRIDVDNAIQPFVNFTATSQANATTLSVRTAFINITSDVNLSVALLEWNYGNGSIINLSMTQVNGGNFTFNITGLNSADHSYKVYGNDSSDILGTSFTRYLTVDGTPPNVSIHVPTNGSNLTTGVQLFNATVNDSDSAISTVRFNISNGTVPVTLAASSLLGDLWNASIDLSTLAEELHEVTVLANDSLDNQNHTESVFFIVDRTAPTVNFELDNNTNFSLATPQIRFNYSDNVFAYANCTVSVDGSVDRSNISTLNGTSTNFTLSSLSEGSHTYSINCTDGSGNAAVSNTHTFAVDTTVPNVSIITPTDVTNLSTETQVFNATVTDTTLSVSAVQFNISNGSNPVLLDAVNAAGDFWNSSLDVSTLAEAVHTLTVLANDTLNNLNNSENVNFTVDRTGPVVYLVSPGNGSTESTIDVVTFNYNSSDLLLDTQNCSFYLDEVLNVTNTTITESLNQNFTVTLPNGFYNWSVQCYDNLGNSGESDTQYLNVTVTDPIVTLNGPANNAYQTDNNITFNCSLKDDVGLSNVTLYGNWSGGWHANETVVVNGTTNSTTFTKEITPDSAYVWNCLSYDSDAGSAFAIANFTTLIDTAAPVISSRSHGNPTTSAATITWTTDEDANSTLQYGTSTALGTNDTNSTKDASHSFSLSGLTASTKYYYNITSCDSATNCNTTGHHSFTTATASSSSSSSSSGGGGGGGGGGGAPSLGAATEESVETEESVTEESTSGGGSEPQEAAAALVEEPAPSAPSVTRVTKALALQDGENILLIEEESVPVTQMSIDALVDRDITVEISLHPQEPEGVPPLERTYEYMEITSDLLPEEYKEIVLNFNVPSSWVWENNFKEDTINLLVFEEDGWKKLPTSFVGQSGTQFQYESTLKHLSFFAITAGEPQLKPWYYSLSPGKMGMKGIVLMGVIMLVVALLVIYFVVSWRDNFD